MEFIREALDDLSNAQLGKLIRSIDFFYDYTTEMLAEELQDEIDELDERDALNPKAVKRLLLRFAKSSD